MLRNAFRKAKPIRGEVLELLDHRLVNDLDFYQATVLLSDGREIEMIMDGHTYRPGTKFSAVLCDMGLEETFTSKTGLPLITVSDAVSHERGLLGTILDRSMIAIYLFMSDEPFEDDAAIMPAHDERRHDPQADYRHKCGEAAQLRLYNSPA